MFNVVELTSLNIKINRELKRQADILFNEMGMTLTTAVNIFVRQAVQEQAIPFRVHIHSERAVAARAKEALKDLQDQAVAIGIENMSIDEINNIVSKTREVRKKSG